MISASLSAYDSISPSCNSSISIYSNDSQFNPTSEFVRPVPRRLSCSSMKQNEKNKAKSFFHTLIKWRKSKQNNKSISSLSTKQIQKWKERLLTLPSIPLKRKEVVHKPLIHQINTTDDTLSLTSCSTFSNSCTSPKKFVIHSRTAWTTVDPKKSQEKRLFPIQRQKNKFVIEGIMSDVPSNEVSSSKSLSSSSGSLSIPAIFSPANQFIPIHRSSYSELSTSQSSTLSSNPKYNGWNYKYRDIDLQYISHSKSLSRNSCSSKSKSFDFYDILDRITCPTCFA